MQAYIHKFIKLKNVDTSVKLNLLWSKNNCTELVNKFTSRYQIHSE